jgi:hypothetical protein
MLKTLEKSPFMPYTRMAWLMTFVPFKESDAQLA